MFRQRLGWLALAALLPFTAPPSIATAQAPPAPVKKSQAQLEAERVLIQARCSLHNEDSKFELKRGQRVMVAPPGHIDHVAFPSDIKDAELTKLMPYVAKLPGLKGIDLGGCDQFTEKGLKSLKVLPKLEALLIDHSALNSAGLKELANVKGLKYLDVSGTSLTDGDMKGLEALQSLTSLVVRQMPRLTEDGIRNILSLGKIRYLDITIEKSREKMVIALSEAKFLASLKVAPISDDEATHLGRMAGLDTLDLSNDYEQFNRLDNKGMARNRPSNTIGNRGLDKLVGCKALRSLDLSYVSVDGSSVSDFTKMASLEELYLRGTRWSDEGAIKLSTMPTLRAIDLRDTQVTDRSMEDLADLPTLQRLYLAGTPITDIGLQDLTRLRTLQVLDLSSTCVSCVRVRDMKNFSQLEHLHLAGTRVTISSFYVLGSIKSLRFLNLLDNLPEVSKTSIAPLQEELPTCFIIASVARPPFYYGSYIIGWPGAMYFSFKIPEVKSVTIKPPPITPSPITPKTVTVTTPPAKTPVVQAPPRPAPPPPLRPVQVGGGSSGRP
jgi:Leucine-rich repeat (LRR) protein